MRVDHPVRLCPEDVIPGRQAEAPGVSKSPASAGPTASAARRRGRPSPRRRAVEQVAHRQSERRRGRRPARTQRAMREGPSVGALGHRQATASGPRARGRSTNRARPCSRAPGARPLPPIDGVAHRAPSGAGPARSGSPPGVVGTARARRPLTARDARGTAGQGAARTTAIRCATNGQAEDMERARPSPVGARLLPARIPVAQEVEVLGFLVVPPERSPQADAVRSMCDWKGSLALSKTSAGKMTRPECARPCRSPSIPEIRLPEWTFRNLGGRAGGFESSRAARAGVLPDGFPTAVPDGSERPRPSAQWPQISAVSNAVRPAVHPPRCGVNRAPAFTHLRARSPEMATAPKDIVQGITEWDEFVQQRGSTGRRLTTC